MRLKNIFCPAALTAGILFSSCSFLTSFENIDEDYTIYGDSTEYFTNYHSEEENNEEQKTTQLFNVEKQYNFIERILEVMFLL